VVREGRLGLTHARLRGFQEAHGEILVYIDDDNVLAPDYLRNTLAAFDADAKLGAVGGKVLPQYEVEPPPWLEDLGISLACRDFGDSAMMMAWPDPLAPDRTYPECSPIGAGIGIRRQAFATYVEAVANDRVRTALGRRGVDLSSGEDNDMIMSILEQGWTVAYLPQLRLDHLIPARRLSADYLERYAYSTLKTWVQVLDVHGICPWPAITPWTAMLRKARAYVRTRAWKTPENRIRWCGACGMIEGRAAIGTGR
jgi:glycosyltransferase involved in cell wall biosynthesis